MDAAGRNRSLPTAPALSPRPLACLEAFRVLAAALPAPGLLREGNVIWFFTVPGRASWLQAQLAAAWARSPASLGPRSRGFTFQPHSRLTFFPPSPPPFVVVANLAFLSSILPFFFPLFLFLLQREEPRGGGVLESFRVMSRCSATEGQRLEQFGAARRCRCPVLRFLVGSLPARVPRSLVFRPSLRRVSPSSSGSVTVPGCWLSPGSPLALMQRPPTSRRTATNQRLAVPL